MRERPGSATLDLGGRYAINKSLLLKAGVLNLTDKVVATDERGRFDGLNGN